MQRFIMGGGRVNRVTWCFAVLMFVLVLPNTPAHAQESSIDKQAMSTVMKMAESAPSPIKVELIVRSHKKRPCVVSFNLASTKEFRNSPTR